MTDDEERARWLAERLGNSDALWPIFDSLRAVRNEGLEMAAVLLEDHFIEYSRNVILPNAMKEPSATQKKWADAIRKLKGGGNDG